MGCKKVVYMAMNMNTKEIHEGTRKDIANAIGCSINTVANYANHERLYEDYKIVSVREDEELTEEDLKKWDEFVKSCRKKKNGRLRKPQKVR